jgi:mono/diheme cytochrome c family protein
VIRPCKAVPAAGLLIALLQAGVALAADVVGTSFDAIERGAYLTTAAGCLSCHTDTENDGEAFAGGHPLETPFGVFYTPNITPDETTGIGDWSADEFVVALREGKIPAGGNYYPSFPYPSYAGISDEDSRDIFAYLQSLEPVIRANQPHELEWYIPGRWSMIIWNALFAPWQYPDIATDDPVRQRGAYLVRHLGHCGECHTPRNMFGALDLNRELGGSSLDNAEKNKAQDAEDKPSNRAPDITPDRENGIGAWSEEELLFFLEMGMYPDGDFVGGSMTAVIDEHTSLLTAEDRQAMVVYLQRLQPR